MQPLYTKFVIILTKSLKRTYSRFSIPQEGKSALHLAAASGHSEAVAALTLNGADVSAQDFVSTTKFHKTRIKMIYPLKIDLSI